MLTILMLHLGVFGIPLYWKSDYSRGVRISLVAVSILYTIFVAVVVVWGISQVLRAIWAFWG